MGASLYAHDETRWLWPLSNLNYTALNGRIIGVARCWRPLGDFKEYCVGN
jgi:hypothetical protein